MTTTTVVGTFKQATGLSIGYSVLMILLGCVAVALPLSTGIGIATLVAWIVILAGFAHLAYAFSAESASTFLWRLLIGIAYVAGGIYLAVHPTLGLESLTLVLAGIFVAEGVLRIVFFFQVRSVPGAGWILFDGIITLVLGFLVVRNWPSSSQWAIGTIVGVNLVVSGFTRLMWSVAARKAVHAAA